MHRRKVGFESCLEKDSAMSKEQKSNREKKKPKQDKSKKLPGAGTAYSQSKVKK
jgi:hypothetical protein